MPVPAQVKIALAAAGVSVAIIGAMTVHKARGSSLNIPGERRGQLEKENPAFAMAKAEVVHFHGAFRNGSFVIGAQNGTGRLAVDRARHETGRLPKSCAADKTADDPIRNTLAATRACGQALQAS